MKKIEKILVVIDANEDYSDAPDGLPMELRKALRFVDDKDAGEIKLLSVGYQKYLHHHFHSIGYDYTSMRKEYMEKLKANMDVLVTKLSADGYKISCEVGWHHPRYEAIVDAAQEFGADLVVQHCRAYATIEHFHLTHDSWNLVKHCPLPLLLVKDKDWGELVTFSAAVDPMHAHGKPTGLDTLILDLASSAAKQVSGDLHVIHAYAESARPFASAGKIKEEHETAFNELLSNYDFAEDKVHFIDETPVFALHDYSEKLDSDVVVMGVISRSRLQEALIGSTAEQVLDYVKTDVFIIKPQ